MHADLDLLWPVALFLAAVVAMLAVTQRLRVDPIIGYLGLGLALGPNGAGLLTSSETIAFIAELGVGFLLFTIGLELSFERLRAMWRAILGLGGLQVAASTAALAGLAVWSGVARAPQALVLGAALALSSTAVVMHLLRRRRETQTRVGHTAFAILLFQDLATVPLLVLVGLPPGQPVLTSLAEALITGTLALAAIVAFGRWVLRPSLTVVDSQRTPEMFLASTLLGIVGAMAAAATAGLSAAVGAFLAGLLLAETEHRARIATDLEPFRALLLGVFFVSVGLGVDPAILFENAATIALAVPVLLGTKALVIAALAAASRHRLEEVPRISLLLSGGGEFAFVLLAAAATGGTADPGLTQLGIAVATATLLLIPALDAAGRSAAAAVSAWRPRKE